jgi:putative ABC transport system permease protein
LIFSEALYNIKLNPLRTIFSILGITIGTAAFVAVWNLGMIFNKVLDEQFNQLGKNIHYFNLNYPKEAIGLNLYELNQLSNGNIKFIIPIASKHVTFRFPNETKESVSIVGIKSKDKQFLNIHLASGRDLVPTDQKQCLISEHLMEQLRKNGVYLKVGSEINVDNEFFEIVGVTKTQQESFQAYFLGNPNKQIVIPIIEDSNFLNNLKIDRLMVEFNSHSNIETKVSILKKQLKDYIPGLSVSVQNLNDIYSTSQGITNSFNLFLLMIGVISLLVGGIGIMNIMYIAVVERKKEIGLRSALGALPKNILFLFLSESLIICLIGSFIGIILSLPFTMIFCQLVHQKFYLFLEPIFVGLIIPICVGLFFGVFPAWKASKISPIRALNET